MQQVLSAVAQLFFQIAFTYATFTTALSFSSLLFSVLFVFDVVLLLVLHLLPSSFSFFAERRPWHQSHSFELERRPWRSAVRALLAPQVWALKVAYRATAVLPFSTGRGRV